MRLIDADELKTKAFGKRGGLIHTSEIDKMPTAEAVTVIRCKDCIHIHDHDCPITWDKTVYDYCSFGERKDG